MTDCIFAKMLESPEMMCVFSSPVTGATDSWFKCLVGLMVKCTCLEVPICCSTST